MLLFEKMFNGLKPFTFFSSFLHILKYSTRLFLVCFKGALCFGVNSFRIHYTLVSDENWIMYKVSELLESIRFISKATFQSIPSNSIETYWANSAFWVYIFSFPTILKICLVRLFLIVLKRLYCLCVVEQVSRANS